MSISNGIVYVSCHLLGVLEGRSGLLKLPHGCTHIQARTGYGGFTVNE